MLNCKQATELMSREQDDSLAFGEHLSLRFHVAMCAGCRNFRKQMAFLHTACARYPETEIKPENDRPPV